MVFRLEQFAIVLPSGMNSLLKEVMRSDSALFFFFLFLFEQRALQVPCYSNHVEQVGMTTIFYKLPKRFGFSDKLPISKDSGFTSLHHLCLSFTEISSLCHHSGFSILWRNSTLLHFFLMRLKTWLSWRVRSIQWKNLEKKTIRSFFVMHIVRNFSEITWQQKWAYLVFFLWGNDVQGIVQ